MPISAADSLRKSIQIYSGVTPKKQKKKTTNQSVFKNNSNPLLSYFEIQTREHAAAAYIQAVWKRLKILQRWRFLSKLLRTIVKIQGVFRGVITRKYLSSWYVLWIKFIIQVQSRIRRYLSNKRTKAQIELEMRMAVKIQSHIRKFVIQKSYYKNLIKSRAAIQIQRLYRGIKARNYSDLMWLSKKIIPIQSLVRKYLSKKKFNVIKYNYTMATIKIQKVIRIYLAQKNIGSKLLDREKRYRNNTISMLSEEEKVKNEKILSLLEFVSSKKIKEKVKKTIKALQQQEILIFSKEKDFVKNLYEINNLTPRSVELEYKEILETKNNELRNEITQLKYNYLFKHTNDFNTAESNFYKYYNKFINLIDEKNFFLYAKENELDDKKFFLLDYEINELKKEKMLKIADEKRKWKVYYYDSAGKPDKNRRPGKPWNPAILASVEKNTYTTGGIINILANLKKDSEVNQNEHTNELKPPEELAKDAIEKLALQNYLLELEAYKKVLAPLEKIMNTYTGLQAHPTPNTIESQKQKPTKSNQSKNPSKLGKGQKIKITKPKPAIPSIFNGWGQIGAEASVALSQLDMISGGDGGPQGPKILEIQKNLLKKKLQKEINDAKSISNNDLEIENENLDSLPSKNPMLEWKDPLESSTNPKENHQFDNLDQNDFISKPNQIYQTSRKSYSSFNNIINNESNSPSDTRPSTSEYSAPSEDNPSSSESIVSTTSEELNYYRQELEREIEKRKKSSTSHLFNEENEQIEVEKLNDLPDLTVANEILNTLNLSSHRRQKHSQKSHKYLPSNGSFYDTFNSDQELNRKIIKNEILTQPKSYDILSKPAPFSLYLNPPMVHQPHSLKHLQKTLLTPIQSASTEIDDKKWYEKRMNMNKKKSLNMILSSSTPTIPLTPKISSDSSISSIEGGDILLYKDAPTEVNVQLSDPSLYDVEKQRLHQLNEEEMKKSIIKYTPSCNNAEDNKLRLEINKNRQDRIKAKNEEIAREKGRAIPWELLDEVDGMEKQFEKEKTYNEYRRGY